MILMQFTILSGLGALFMAYALVKFSGESKPAKKKRKHANDSILVRGCAAKIVAFRGDAMLTRTPAAGGGRYNGLRLRNKTEMSSNSAKKQDKSGELARMHR